MSLIIKWIRIFLNPAAHLVGKWVYIDGDYTTSYFVSHQVTGTRVWLKDFGTVHCANLIPRKGNYDET